MDDKKIRDVNDHGPDENVESIEEQLSRISSIQSEEKEPASDQLEEMLRKLDQRGDGEAPEEKSDPQTEQKQQAEPGKDLSETKPQKKQSEAEPQKKQAKAEPQKKQAETKPQKKQAEAESQKKQDEAPEKSKKKSSVNGKKIAAVTAIVLGALLVIGYFAGVIFYNGHFFHGTSINEMNFSEKTVAEVQSKLTEAADNYVLTLQERENMTEKIKGSDIDLKMVFDSSFEQLLKQQNPFAWFMGFFKKSTYSVGSSLQYDEKKLIGAINGLKASNQVLMIAPVDAAIEWNETDQYYISPGVAGTQLNTQKFEKAITDAVENLEDTLNLDEKNCYVAQNIDEHDQRLINAAAELNKYSKAVITYNINGSTETCDGSVIRTWLALAPDYSVQISSEAARAYIDTLGDKYNTYGTTRSFTATNGNVVQITKGDYGWRMNRADMTDELIAAVRQGGAQTKEPLWLQTANANGAQDWGNTYVEINLGAQHLYFYKNGELIVESDFVSGKMSGGRATPEGIYSLKYKEKNRTLRGDRREDGSWGYESFVNFWMPFNGGVGMHDASWRGSFGGSIYINSGSHGCVNLPYSKAKAIYENIDSGTPIICFYGGGTPAAAQEENTQAEEQTPAAAEPQEEAPQTEDQTQPEPQPETPAQPEEQQPAPSPQPEASQTVAPQEPGADEGQQTAPDNTAAGQE